MTQSVPASPVQPPEAPHSFDIKSKAGHFGAHIAWPEKHVSVHALGGGRKKELWAIDGWSSVAFISDQGPVLALGHPANNLLPLESADTTEIVAFYRDGKKVFALTLADISKSAPPHRQPQGIAWGVHYGFDTEGRYRYEDAAGVVRSVEIQLK